VVTLPEIVRAANGGFLSWITDRKNRRAIPHPDGAMRLCPGPERPERRPVDHQRDPPGGLRAERSINQGSISGGAAPRALRKFIDFRITAFTAFTARTREFRQPDTNFGPRRAVSAMNA
jgi:hypothetical protein